MARNILYVPTDTQEIKIAYRSKYNRKRKNQVILMIMDNEQQDSIEKYHYIALKSEENDDGYV